MAIMTSDDHDGNALARGRGVRLREAPVRGARGARNVFARRTTTFGPLNRGAMFRLPSGGQPKRGRAGIRVRNNALAPTPTCGTIKKRRKAAKEEQYTNRRCQRKSTRH